MAVNLHRLIAAKFLDHGIIIIAINLGSRILVKVSKEAKRKKTFTQIEGIVGHADMMLGSSVKEILQAHIDVGEGLFKGIRHGASWDLSEEIRNSHSNPIRHIYLNENFQQIFYIYLY